MCPGCLRRYDEIPNQLPLEARYQLGGSEIMTHKAGEVDDPEGDLENENVMERRVARRSGDVMGQNWLPCG